MVTQQMVIRAAMLATCAQGALIALAAALGCWGGVGLVAPVAAYTAACWARERRIAGGEQAATDG